MKMRKLIAILSICILIAGCNGNTARTAQPSASDLPTQQTAVPIASAATEQPTAAPSATPEPTPALQPVEVSVMAVGDIMFHGAQITAAFSSKTKSYSFDYSYQFIKDIISGADLALGNFECTLGGPDKPYSKPDSMSFNAPDSAAVALKEAGFDILSTANNHTNDRGRDGVIRTVDVLRQSGLVCVGTRKDTGEKPYYIADVKGIKIGFTAYSFGSRNSDLLNVYSNNLSGELAKMSQVIKDMRADGAEIVVFYIHWGSEYQRKPGAGQKKMAQGLADAGVDIIFGSHPHVLQTVEVIHSAKTGKKTFVAYSMGNFISNQITRWNATKFQYTEDSMILKVKIVKQPDGSPAELSTVEYLPVWTMLQRADGPGRYAVLPLEKALQSPIDFDMKTGYDKKKAQMSLNETNKLLADAVAKGYIALMSETK